MESVGTVNFLMLLADPEPTSIGVIMGVVAIVMAVVKVFEEVIRYLIAELKRRKEGEPVLLSSSDGEIDCTHGCAECQRKVQTILKLLRGEMRESMQARIDDLTSQRDDYKESAAEATAAVNRLARAVQDGFDMMPDETEEEEEGE